MVNKVFLTLIAAVLLQGCLGGGTATTLMTLPDQSNWQAQITQEKYESKFISSSLDRQQIIAKTDTLPFEMLIVYEQAQRAIRTLFQDIFFSTSDYQAESTLDIAVDAPIFFDSVVEGIPDFSRYCGITLKRHVVYDFDHNFEKLNITMENIFLLTDHHSDLKATLSEQPCTKYLNKEASTGKVKIITDDWFTLKILDLTQIESLRQWTDTLYLKADLIK